MDLKEIQKLIKGFDKNSKQRICALFAIKCAEQNIHLYAQDYPNDTRPQMAIEATKEWLRNPTPATVKAARETIGPGLLAAENTVSESGDYSATESAANSAAYAAGTTFESVTSPAEQSAYYAASNAAVAYVASDSPTYATDDVMTRAEAYDAAQEYNENDARIVALYEKEHAWQRQTLIKIIKDYKKSQVYALMLPVNVGNLPREIFKTMYEYL